MTKRKKLIIAAAALLVCVISTICINKSMKPKHYYSSEVGGQRIEYRGKSYYPIGDSGAYEYRLSKTLAKGAMYSISSLENDDDINFLSYSEWQYHEMFTCIEDYEEKYPFGVCYEDRITSIRLQNDSSGITEYDSTSRELNDIFLHPESYSDLTPASFPLRYSGGFSCTLYAFMDDLPITSCRLGKLAHYDGKWIFVDKDTEVEGYGNKYSDTRTFTGIEINNPKAVQMLDEYSKKYFDYILSD